MLGFTLSALMCLPNPDAWAYPTTLESYKLHCYTIGVSESRIRSSTWRV